MNSAADGRVTLGTARDACARATATTSGDPATVVTTGPKLGAEQMEQE